MDTCPAVDVLVAFTTGELPEARALEIENHIDTCGECRSVLSSHARGGPPPALGRYRIDTVLGSGGMGIVYRGFDPQLARPVAIKVLRRTGEDPAARARLVREAQALARLSHPNVCHVYDVGTEGEEVWVAMELIDGVHLRQWAETGRESSALMDVLLGAAEGIAAAHAAGLVHRDIKPENVLVTRDGRAIVTDFGLARNEDKVDVNAPTMASDPHLTATGAIAGTPAYLAPEQLLGDPLDARVDQFAWAVMAWELLAGERPFPIVFAVRLEAIRAGIAPSPKMPAHVAAALLRAMKSSPADRFDSMREVIDALRAPAATRSPAIPARLRGAAIAGVVVLAAGAIAATQWPKQAPQAHREPPPPPPVQAQVVAPSPPPPPSQAEPEALPPAPAAAANVPRLPPDHPEKARPPQRTKPQELSAQEPTGPVLPPAPAAPAQSDRRYCRSCQVATVDAFCRIPMDFENTGSKSNYEVVDWGTVTKVEDEHGTFGDEKFDETIITMRGQRKIYRFSADFLDSYVTTTVGALVAICPEGESDIYQLTGGPTTVTQAVITLSAPPKILEAAKLGARHVHELEFAREAGHGVLDDLEPDGRYLVNVQVLGIDGERYRMDRYTMRVPSGLKNSELLVPKKHVWVVVEKPRFEDAPDGKALVVTAVKVIGDLFP